MIGEKNITLLIRAEIKRELANQQLTGKGGNTLISSEADIDIVTKGKHIARYNGNELASATSLTGSFLPLGGGSMTGDITHNLCSGDKYYNSAEGAIVAGNIRAFHGTTYYDFLITTNGLMYLQAALGISVNCNIAMGGYKLTGLAAGTLNGQAIRYDEYHTHEVNITTLHLPSQSGASGKVLMSNGTSASWSAALSGYLPLTAGIGSQLTGDLYINKVTPILFLNQGGTTRADFYWVTNTYLDSADGSFYISTTSGAGDSIYLRTNGTTRLTIADSLISSLVQNSIDVGYIPSPSLGVDTFALRLSGGYGGGLGLIDGSGNFGIWLDTTGTYARFGFGTSLGILTAMLSLSASSIGAGASIIPSANDSYNLGSSSYKWSILHAIDIISDTITTTTVLAPVATDLSLRVSSGRSIIFQAV